MLLLAAAKSSLVGLVSWLYTAISLMWYSLKSKSMRHHHARVWALTEFYKINKTLGLAPLVINALILSQS